MSSFNCFCNFPCRYQWMCTIKWLHATVCQHAGKLQLFLQSVLQNRSCWLEKMHSYVPCFIFIYLCIFLKFRFSNCEPKKSFRSSIKTTWLSWAANVRSGKVVHLNHFTCGLLNSLICIFRVCSQHAIWLPCKHAYEIFLCQSSCVVSLS